VRKYLVVDDNQAFAENLAEILADTGAEVEIAASGVAALDRIRRGRFDLVISDMRMPHMGGAELLRQLRSIQPGLPTIVITAYTNDDEIQMAREEGVLAVLPKPAPIERLLDLCAVARRNGLVALVDGDAASAENVIQALSLRGFAVVCTVSGMAIGKLVRLRPFVAVVDAGVAEAAPAPAMASVAAMLPGVPLVQLTTSVGEVVAAVENAYGAQNG